MSPVLAKLLLGAGLAACWLSELLKVWERAEIRLFSGFVLRLWAERNSVSSCSGSLKTQVLLFYLGLSVGSFVDTPTCHKIIHLG